METMRKLAQKEIHFAWAIGIVLVVAIFSATTVGVKAWASFYFGGQVTSYQPVCVLDPDSGTCPNCPVCTGNYGSACAGMEEVQFTPYGGMSNYICPPQGYLYLGGKPRPGGYILGWGSAANTLSQVGVSH